MNNAITSFRGEYRWLSNFYPCPHKYLLEWDGDEIIYPSTEHAYQAAKTKDLGLRAKIASMTPGESKKFTRQHPDIHPIESDEEKLKLMRLLIKQKFSNDHIDLRDKLIATKDRDLVEQNDWGDSFWGIVNTHKSINSSRVYPHGQNHLGKILMEHREELFRIKKIMIECLSADLANENKSHMGFSRK